MKKRALLSVYDKRGLGEFAKNLAGLGWELVSTGGTARAIRGAGLPVTDVSDVTGFPEILDGRVKTLHPMVHGGILAKGDDEQHVEQLKALNISPVHMVVCNLYPFVEAQANPKNSFEDILEQIDIGGPTLLRAAAKNFAWTIPVCDPNRYPDVIERLTARGDLDYETRRDLAVQAVNHTAFYDAAVASFLGGSFCGWPLNFPEEITFGYNKGLDLRYGENPHQRAAFYEPQLGGRGFEQLGGKDLSYNNINDASGAFRAVWDLPETSCVIVKHGAPCGAATGKTPRDAFEKAFEGDSLSAFGGVVSFNCEVDEETALAMKKPFLEVVLAPRYTSGGLGVLKAKKDLRILKVDGSIRQSFGVKSALGGLLIQEEDRVLPGEEDWRVVSRKKPTQEQMQDLKLAVAVCKHVRSNAVVMVKGGATVGIGGGQPNRVDCVKIAAERGKERLRGSVMASDAFFPFPDAVEEAAKAGVVAVAHPGGSLRDDESLKAADALGLVMVITGKRHFLH